MAAAGQERDVLFRLAKRAAAGRVAKQLPLFKVLAIAQVALLARRHVQRLGPGEARRLADLVRRKRSLTPAEQDELRALTAKLEPGAFVGAAADKFSPVPLPKRFTGAHRKR
ncbi:MAG: hypothetical protein JWO90_2110 [Solirubrobacterales bacterium]|nr:hypothetical protein [Solirubrobacterales bacterium]